jgi:predicted nucleic acid-binding protein
VAGGCDVIVTGDRDLLDLKAYGKIRIDSPRNFWRHNAGRKGE